MGNPPELRELFLAGPIVLFPCDISNSERFCAVNRAVPLLNVSPGISPPDIRYFPPKQRPVFRGLSEFPNLKWTKESKMPGAEAALIA
jgi:hypothetical protein